MNVAQRPTSEAISVTGPAGGLEAILESPADVVPRGLAVVCHPHPLHGGTMHNKVAHTLARAFLSEGFSALRFNFRGVGASDGKFADGDGETGDVVAALEYAQSQVHAGDVGESIWLAGFSFGAAMAVRVAAERDVAGLVSVAPAAFRFAGTLSGQPRCPWLVVHGDADDVVPIEESVKWLDGLEPGPELVVFPEAGHFFHGRLVELRETVQGFVQKQASAASALD